MIFLFQTKSFIYPPHLLIEFPFPLTQLQFPSLDKYIFSCNYFDFFVLVLSSTFVTGLLATVSAKTCQLGFMKVQPEYKMS